MSIPDLAAFAASRGWRYEPVAPPPPIEGAVFGALLDASVTDHVVASGDIPFEVGNVSGRVGGSSTQQFGDMTVKTFVATPRQGTYGYLSIHLPTPLPHMVLDAVANDRGGRSSLPFAISGGQRVSLEGDFDRHFSLFAPAGYERDALYLFTPDVMALLIDETGDLDVELVGERLTVFSPTPFDLRDPAVWERLEQIVKVLGGKAIRQSDRYRDERAEAGTIAAPGLRLQQGPLSRRGIITTFLLIGGITAVVFVTFVGTLLWIILG